MEALVHRHPFVFIGENLSVDLVNTVKMVNHQLTDLLDSPAALQEWADAVGVAVGELSQDYPRIVRLRDLLSLLYREYLEARYLAFSTLAAFNQFLVEAGVHPALTIDAQGVPAVHMTAHPPSPLVAAVVESALALLSNPEQRERLKRCENPACVLLFVDRSKNRTRRWCDMDTCGNRLKASRHYQRQRAALSQKEEEDPGVSPTP